VRKRLALAGGVVMLIGIVLANVALSSSATPEAPSKSWGRNLFAAAEGNVGAQSHEGGQTLVVTTREIAFKNINVNGRGFTPGDYFLFRERVFNRAGKQIGLDNGTCQAQFPLTQQRAGFLCEVAFTFFGRGQVMTEGRIQFGPRTTSVPLAITGGTGHFQNVRGEIHVAGEQQTRITLHLLP
jgi:hypothetical protein